MSIEQEFHQAMVGVYIRAKDECGYNAARFIQMVETLGGLAAARRLLSTDEAQAGFTELWQLGRLDITVECLVLQPRWRTPFSEQELARARHRLKSLGFDPTSCE